MEIKLQAWRLRGNTLALPQPDRQRVRPCFDACHNHSGDLFVNARRENLEIPGSWCGYTERQTQITQRRTGRDLEGCFINKVS